MANALWLSRFRLFIKRWLKTGLALPGLLLRPRPPYLRVLFYHRINPYPFAELGPVSRELTVHPDMFERQLQHLARRGYRSATVEEFARMMVPGGTVDPRAILITFDDGYEDNLLWAAPLLRKHGFSAAVFVVSGFIGKSTADVWPNSDPGPLGKFLDAGQIMELKQYGIDVGSHTVSHPLLSGLPREAQFAELEASKRRLEQMTGGPVSWFVYPGGDFNAVTEEAVKQAGYTLAFTTIPGVNRPGVPLSALRRTEVSASDSMLVFSAKLAGALDWLAFKESAGVRRIGKRINDVLVPLVARRSVADD